MNVKIKLNKNAAARNTLNTFLNIPYLQNAAIFNHFNMYIIVAFYLLQPSDIPPANIK